MILATRILVIATTIAAALIEAFLASTYTPSVFWLSTALFIVMLIAGQRLRGAAMPIVMAALYLAPAVLLVALDARDYGLDVIWILPLLGLILSDQGWREWSLPAKWQWPLITVAVIVAITWPIVFLREANFAPWILLDDTRVSNTSMGIAPSQVDQNIAYFALLHNVGILWIDALCRWYRDARARFRREVLSGLVVAAGIAGAVSLYQGLVDLGFLNPGFWQYMIRAPGTLGDPNKLGAVAGLWTVGAIVYARAMKRSWQLPVTIAALVLGIGAAWVCGSRTGLASVLISCAIAAFEAVRWLKPDVRKLAIAAVAVLVLGGALAGVLQRASTHTIVQRGTLGYLPFFGDRGIANSVNELLWDRFGYGPAAIQMIKEHPVAGVGVGTYHVLSYDFGKAAGRIIPAPDNAQAWWRQNAAELGLLGSIPFLIWLVVFGRTLFAGSASGDPFSAGMLRGVLIAFFIASLFGVPSQSMAITATFWVLVFWFVMEQGTAAETLSPNTAGPWPRAAVVGAIVLIAVQAGTTTAYAFGDLLPQNRAQRFGWYYRYGFVQPDDVEADPGGNPVGRRWALRKSLAVIPVQGRALKFVAWIDHPDANERPVHARVWADGKLMFEGDLRLGTPIMMDIAPTPGKKYMVVETEIDRTFRPQDFNPLSRDRRELGLSIRDWTWS